MTVFYSIESTGPLNTTPAAMANGVFYRSKLRCIRASITMASQTTSDTIVLGVLPAGSIFAFGMITASATLGSTQVAIGITGTTSKYKAAGTFTNADTPTLFGVATVMAGTAALTAEETVFVTISAATMPSSGTLVFHLYYLAV